MKARNLDRRFRALSHETRSKAFDFANSPHPPQRGDPWPSVENPKPKDAKPSHHEGRTMKAEVSLYRWRGKPQRRMEEIRRMLMRKISARLEKERAEADLLKDLTPPQRIHDEDEIKIS